MAVLTVNPLLFLCFFLFCSCHAAPNTTQQRISFFSLQGSPWRVNEKLILVSPNGTFAAGFRSLPTSSGPFLFAVWYQQDISQTIVWAANRDSPVTLSSSLRFSSDGQLSLVTVTSLFQDARTHNANFTKLILEETGCLRFDKWSSCAYPTDTILPNQTFQSSPLVSSKSRTDYGSGNYTFVNSTFLFFSSIHVYGSTQPLKMLIPDGTIVKQNGDPYITEDVDSPNRLRRLTLDPDGNLRVYSLDVNTGSWRVVWRAVSNPCRIRGRCPPNFVCTSDCYEQVKCICPPGFGITDGNSCERKIRLSGDPSESKFLRLDFVNFTSDGSRLVQVGNFTSCERRCLEKTTCLGFTYGFNGSQYCVHHLDKLYDGYWSPFIQIQAMFLRVSKYEAAVSKFTGMTELESKTCKVRIGLPESPARSNSTTRNLAIVSSFFALELILGVLFFWTFLHKHIKHKEFMKSWSMDMSAGGLKRFTYAELRSATNDFADVIGSGGFGTVYKGQLSDQRVIAVKRLKQESHATGVDPKFWAEAATIARMHHLNLVRLWGFCTEKGERLLVYEYVPNGSLDKHLFTKDDRPVMDLNTRYRIAVGVARAIAYLHEECPQWVLHCDIKPENILLQNDFCPRVSDFGLAKLVNKEDFVSRSNTPRGTAGYIAPEWVRAQPITAKADVYSFGMLLLEIVTGVRSSETRLTPLSTRDSADWYLPEWAYQKACKEKNLKEILDRRMPEMYDDQQQYIVMVERMVKTAMWCLQERPERRPSMGEVARMLEGAVQIVEPDQPTIFFLTASVPQSATVGAQNDVNITPGHARVGVGSGQRC